MSNPCISLITDFGSNSPFVGTLKTVLLSHAPNVNIIDMFHDVGAYNIDEARFWLSRTYPYSPKGSIHVSVVDPGVGSERRIVVAKVADRLFLAPDNGLLDQVFAHQAVEYRELDVESLKKKLKLSDISNTFHGRDIFAPLAAALATGKYKFDRVGPVIDDIVAADISSAWKDGYLIFGNVVSVDHYGNVFSNIDAHLINAAEEVQVSCGGKDFAFKRTYADGIKGEHIALINSFNVLELASVQGDAAAECRLSRGDQVRVKIKNKE